MTADEQLKELAELEIVGAIDKANDKRLMERFEKAIIEIEELANVAMDLLITDYYKRGMKND